MMFLHDRFMDLALKEAEKAYEKKEIPVGAVIVDDERIVGRGHNLVEHLQDPTAHAEILAITSAANTLASWRLNNCTLYVTLEPCPMCAGAILMSRISRIVFGAFDPKFGACGSVFNVVDNQLLNSSVEVIGGIGEDRCSSLLNAFFENLRKK
jgi:tRNA(adenine34) deaminase